MGMKGLRAFASPHGSWEITACWDDIVESGQYSNCSQERIVMAGGSLTGQDCIVLLMLIYDCMPAQAAYFREEKKGMRLTVK